MIFNIRDFGAKGNGLDKDTIAFRMAIEECKKYNGGTIYVPSGVYLTGPIHLISNTTLYLDSGAVLKFSQDISDYPLVYTRWEGEESDVYSPQIYAENVDNVTIKGHGTIDGQGQTWWKLKWENKLQYPRPRLICFYKSSNITIDGIKIKNSPSWTINPIECINITVHNVTITNPYDSPNTDGINPESCKGVKISNCYIDVGDDCVTLKSGTEDCKERIPCENISITNCIMAHGHGGVVIGSEMSGGVRNVVISNCIFEGTDRGIRIKTRRGRGGVVEDIRVNNIIMKKVISPFVMHMYYHCGKNGKLQKVWDKAPYPVDETTPIFRRIYISNVTVREVTSAAGFIYGLTEMPIQDVEFTNITIHLSDQVKPDVPAMMTHLEPMARKGFIVNNAENIKFINVSVDNQDEEAFVLNNCNNVEFISCSSNGERDYEKIIKIKRRKNIIRSK